VDESHRPQGIPSTVAQTCEIAGERGRLAGDIDDPLRPTLPDDPNGCLRAAGPRRIQNQRIDRRRNGGQRLLDLAAPEADGAALVEPHVQLTQADGEWALLQADHLAAARSQ